MEKKPEEIMAIVLDYCHHACPEIGKNVPLYEGAYLKKDIDGYGIYHYWGSDRGNATCICTVPTRSTFIANPNVFTAFYKLLGLDKRDALEAERGKSAKLVEAFEEIKKPWYIFNLGKRASLKNTLEQYKTRCMAIQDIVSRALEAYKEGKKDEN